MPLLMDTCVITAAFDVNNQEHENFKPLMSWLRNAESAKLALGGTKYKKELAQLRDAKYTGVLAELRRSGKIVLVDDSAVDREAGRLKAMVPAVEFNDEHLMSIVIVAGCRVVATYDDVAIKYLKNRSLYPAGTKIPKIYQKAAHQTLCLRLLK